MGSVWVTHVRTQVDSVMFLAGAGDKCALAEYLKAVHEANPLHSFISGTQLLRLPYGRDKFRDEIRSMKQADGVSRWIFKPCSGGPVFPFFSVIFNRNMPFSVHLNKK